MNILGIETSCDETSASVVNNGQLLSNEVFSQTIHNEYGGVVPEVASREHEAVLSIIVKLALKSADINVKDIDCISVTNGPGLMGALLVGVNYAKGLAISLDVPFLGINHMEGHLFANFINNPELKYPFICLLVSGGHTQIWKVNSFDNYSLLATTRDDAAGEAFDKGARILGLGYPGGPEIEKSAVSGDDKSYKFPIPIVKSSHLDFSFSGLKTALLYTCNKMNKIQLNNEIHNLAASYQSAIINTLIDRLEKAIEETGISIITISGGVAANKSLRKNVINLEQKYNINVYFPPMEYCTDNAAMIALTGYNRFKQNEKSLMELVPNPNLSMENLSNV